MTDLTLSYFSERYLSAAQPTLAGYGRLHSVFSSAAAVERLFRITLKLIENGRKFNLTSILEPEEIIRKHIIDSIIPLGLMEERGIVSKEAESTLADVGTGAGFPCLPMAAVSLNYFPIHYTGIDSTAKKVAHIRETAEFTGLCNLNAIAGRAEELSVFGKGGTMRESFDTVTARAVAALPVLLELTSPFVKPGGYFCALKSANAENELCSAGDAHKKLGMTLKEIISYEIPGGDSRTMIIYQKTTPTPVKFPRRYAEISKQPLK